MKKEQLIKCLLAAVLLAAQVILCACSDPSLEISDSSPSMSESSGAGESFGETESGALSYPAKESVPSLNSQSTPLPSILPSQASPLSPDPTPTSTPTPTPTPTPDFDPLEFYNYQYEFKADLSAYEQYMNPQGNDYLTLVNAKYPLPSTFIPENLTDVTYTREGRDKVKLVEQAEKALQALFLEADANGMLYKNKVWQDNGIYYDYYVLSVTHAYRSYSYQEYLYNSYVERDKALYPDWTLEQVKAHVATYSCPPGMSEHQTGLCVDMHNFRAAGRDMADDFANSEAGKWLQENCYKFGYVLRFEKDKTDITGITYESWHFRYVGRFHATRMHELDMCLEEYCAYLAEYGYEINGHLS
ncbi:MAG: M15 family metallopeptidase [Clostridia bacterium]|nr:M15 family metallopeptidase [Clostridia bacterium]